MDINNTVRRYKANRDEAMRRALERGELPDFQIGMKGASATAQRRGAMPTRRSTVNWKAQMSQGPVGRRQRGVVGQSSAIYKRPRLGTGRLVATTGSSNGGSSTLPPWDPGYPQGYPVHPECPEYELPCPIDTGGSMPTGMGCEDVPPCGTNVIGGTTLGTVGIAPGQTGQVVITAGDAGYFQPRALYWEALPFGSENLVDCNALPSGCCVLPSLLIDAAIGRVSMLRRGGSPDRALTQGGFANTKELVALDWGEFLSVNEQFLTLFFFNPCQDQPIHVFVDLWGNI